jgi:hypothetical protein
MSWFAVLLYIYAAGISGALAFVPPADLGRGFFKAHGWLLLALVILATVVGRPLFGGIPAGHQLLVGMLAWALAADVVAVTWLVAVTARPINPIAYLIPMMTGAALAVLIAVGRAPGHLGEASAMTVHLATSGALLGSALVAMILGHWYLQNASLSFGILTRLARIFVGSALAKAAISGVYLAPEAGRWWPRLLSEFDGLLVLVRVVAGLAAPIVFGFMVLACARAKANQSATGILYVAVIFTLVGELISIYMTLGRGIPL